MDKKNEYLQYISLPGLLVKFLHYKFLLCPVLYSRVVFPDQTGLDFFFEKAKYLNNSVVTATKQDTFNLK